MTTYIEIVDTAVKIGLGAIISGFATFLVTKLKGRQSFKNESIKNSRVLIERVAIGLEESASLLTRIALLVFSEDPSDNERRIDEARKHFLEVHDKLNQVEALSIIAGDDELNMEIDQFSKMVMDIHNLVRFDPYNIKKMDEYFSKLTKVRRQVRNAIRKNYIATLS